MGDSHFNFCHMLFFVGDCLPHFLIKCLNPFCVFDDNFSFGRQFQLTFAPVKNFDSELLFQKSNVMAYGGLCKRENFRCSCEILFFVYNQKCLKLNIQHILTTILKIYYHQIIYNLHLCVKQYIILSEQKQEKNELCRNFSEFF